ncbi:MAG: hypothetical protein QOF83_4178 [Solirubrobacteraceae bacterium]|jgi:hypothetical protein|nr:hypothetical protein [Solirubrobacteraceae bacterium]
MISETERSAVRAVAVLTAVSGVAQAAAPGALLRPLRVDDTPATRQLFGTIGMFMAVVGGLLLASLRRGDPQEVLVWTAAQKLGAAGAVALGVRRSVFSPRALLVAGFDFCSGVLVLDYRRRTRHR